jgi:protein gp37
MADKSAIEWTDATWNPIRARNIKTGKVGWHCEHATTGCEFCYSEGFNKRLGTGLAFKPGHRAEIEIFLDETMLTQPLRWKKPRMIFVCSMTDLFADFVPDEFIDKMFAIMALSPQHTFQVLTKRARRMRDYCSTIQKNGRWLIMEDIAQQLGYEPRGEHDHGFDWISNKQFLPNVWLGVSAERQPEADERIPLLLQTPAAVRFISAEPLLGAIDLIGTFARFQDDPIAKRQCAVPLGRQLIDWVIVGGESGRNARPMHSAWARSLRDQCAAAGVAFFFKQWGEWAPHNVIAGGDLGSDVRAGRVRIVHPTGQSDVEVSKATGGRNTIPGSRYMARVGKKAAGRLLDGVEHNGFPARSSL